MANTVDLTAFEYEQKHVDFIRKQNPDTKVIKGDWSRLSELLQLQPEEGKPIDFVYSLGRTIAHNRTPDDMFHLFDEVHKTLRGGGRFLFDLPDVDWGLYQERINRFRENLEVKGVLPLKSGLIFDGPNDADKFNRMILFPEQIKAIAFLLGYKQVDTRHELIGERGEIKNVYNTFEKIDGWDPQKITRQELENNLKVLGLSDPGTDYDMYVVTWGMTLGQAIVYVENFGLGNEYLRRLNETGRGPDVFVKHDGLAREIETSGISTLDYLIALNSKGKSKAEVDRLIQDVRKRRISIQELETKASSK